MATDKTVKTVRTVRTIEGDLDDMEKAVLKMHGISARDKYRFEWDYREIGAIGYTITFTDEESMDLN